MLQSVGNDRDIRIIIREYSNVNTSKRLQETLEAWWSSCVFILLSSKNYAFSMVDVVSSNTLLIFS